MNTELNTKTPYKIYSNSIEEAAIKQFEDCLNMDGCIQGALLPDSHLGYTAPIGSVLKFESKISAQLVGFDIGCGVACLELNINYKEVDLKALKQHIIKTVPIGFNSHKKSAYEKDTLDFTGTSKILQDLFSKKGTTQLGTLGGG